MSFDRTAAAKLLCPLKVDLPVMDNLTCAVRSIFTGSLANVQSQSVHELTSLMTFALVYGSKRISNGRVALKRSIGCLFMAERKNVG